jgi:hypothetical protein
VIAEDKVHLNTSTNAVTKLQGKKLKKRAVSVTNGQEFLHGVS